MENDTEGTSFKRYDLSYVSRKLQAQHCTRPLVRIPVPQSQQRELCCCACARRSFCVYNLRMVLSVDIIPKAKGGLLYLSGWHPFCVQWRDGKVRLYRQDTDFGEETYNDLEGQLVGSGGKLIIGAAQRCYGGCFQESLTFRGNLSQVNIWTNVLGGSEVDKVISSCGGYSDTPAALNWKTIQVPPLNGGVLISCEGGCQSGPAEEKSCDLVFSTRSPSNFASLTIQDDLVEFTICAWYSFASNAADNVILSYVTQDYSSQFQIKIKQDGNIEVMINSNAKYV
ncbi:predicted protein [Nematostella vectensis]|uniref:Pentraxin (PTX) domain-containing protein n=1 Tax=Nematostella vectensis TaxID=45351 RepID=A7SNW4_NEMVE|nr:predicted protein [Nematostella vectensis]|eukprot:XP_001626734.1 predicted protein [Nematostella vectensis]